MATVDMDSPPRSWLEAWVNGARTKDELRTIINEQQDRLDGYVRQIESLERERNEILRWQIESTHQDMMNRGVIQRYKTALESIAASGSLECAAIAETALRPT